MPQIPIDQAIQIAVRHQQAGQLAQAEAIYRQILSVQPEHPDAWHFLGVVAFQASQPTVAIELIRRSLAFAPACPAALSNLADALRAANRFDEAAGACREAIRLQPDFPEAYNNLGNALGGNGLLDEAIHAYRTAVQMKPDFSRARANLGNALREKGRVAEAIAEHREVLRFNPASAEAHNDLGSALGQHWALEEAVAAFREAIRLRSNYPEAHYNLGCALKNLERYEEAVVEFREAIRLEPGYPEAHNNLGNALGELGFGDKAVAEFQEAIRLKPDFAEAHTNLGGCYKALGRIDLAIESLRKAVAFGPTIPAIRSNLIFSLGFHPASDAKQLLAEALEWDRVHAKPLERWIKPHGNAVSTGRRLRIGYVSPDFCKHVVGRNILSLLRAHDRDHFEVFCYSNTRRPDAITEKIQNCVEGWREIVSVDDEPAADMIREDKIDVLVDLALHSAGNRLPLFARKPAPVQATYFGYCGTSGLEAMDYRLSDSYIDPPGTDLGCYSEKTVRLPRAYWCYEPLETAPEISPLPAGTLGYLTFACRNNFGKITPQVQECWIQIMRALPGSRLILQAPHGSGRTAVLERFERGRIAAERLTFAGNDPWQDFMRGYGKVDLALDPFPYSGWITTCDALWMGIPVVSLSGATAVGRGGRTILSNIGLPELVASTPEEYVEIAIALGKDLPRLSELRATLRERMENSPMRDAQGLARDLEAAYREMWQGWCGPG